MRTAIRIEAVAAVALACAPAFAQAPPSDTIKAVLKNGAVFTVQGQEYDFVAKADGSYTDTAGALRGAYRVDGKKLCITPGSAPEGCLEFPDSKGSGDVFDVAGDGRTARVVIR